MLLGKLYIVATPIGNLDDISKRALDTLESVDIVLAEDTRVAQKLLSSFGIKKRLESYHQHSSIEKQLEILNLLLNGKNMALVTDAGTPGISDPGNELVEFLLNSNKEITVVPIPGPSAVTAALSVCGFDVSQHMFLGFWPKKKQTKTINLIKSITFPFAFFESPHRILKTLNKLSEELGGERLVFIGRELTKMHETHYRGTITEVTAQIEAEKFLKGEMVVVVNM